jgi:hypothetical protein
MSHSMVEQYRGDCLDACELHHLGFLDGRRHQLTAGLRWPKLESLALDPTAITVVHKHGHERTLAISWTKAFANSYRLWIVCNHCGQRYARLFRGFAGYACRECLELWYQCQTVSTHRRMKRRLAQLCMPIDDQPSHYLNAQQITFPKRPPGMHRGRYYRLPGQAAHLQAKFKLAAKTLWDARNWVAASDNLYALWLNYNRQGCFPELG